MKIKEIVIRQLKMILKNPFTTSFGTVQEKQFLLLEAKDESGITGWGESVAFEAPWYTEETMKTNWVILEDFLIPLVLNREINHPSEISRLFKAIKRNNMAKSTIEGAYWDIYSQLNGQSLAKTIGGTKDKIEAGISIGIQKNEKKQLEVIEKALMDGYKRIKVKIKPGLDVKLIRLIREHFPNIPLMADANSAYSLKDIELLKQLDEFNLLMIEQPLASDDIVDHAALQKEINTPICLDESITSFEDAKKAIQLKSCGVINIKIGRVGGIDEAIKIHDYCQEHGVPVWCGGMLESGIGRAHNIALTSLSNFTLPGDTAGSSHYWEEDIITPEVVVENGFIYVPQKPGIGYEPNLKAIEKYTVAMKAYK